MGSFVVGLFVDFATRIWLSGILYCSVRLFCIDCIGPSWPGILVGALECILPHTICMASKG